MENLEDFIITYGELSRCDAVYIENISKENGRPKIDNKTRILEKIEELFKKFPEEEVKNKFPKVYLKINELKEYFTSF